MPVLYIKEHEIGALYGGLVRLSTETSIYKDLYRDIANRLYECDAKQTTGRKPKLVITIETAE